MPLARKYGAALIVGCIDEDKSRRRRSPRERKLAIAERAHKLPDGEVRHPPSRHHLGPARVPLRDGRQELRRRRGETIEGIAALKERFPRTRRRSWASRNVSFGLPDAGREVLNSVFLYHCTKAGLDLAIVNSEKLERYASIPEDEQKLAEDLLFNRGEDPVAAFAAHFRGKKQAAKTDRGDAAAGRAAGELHHRGHEGRAGRGSRARSGRTRSRSRSSTAR